jgi:hypothetical protein
MTITIIGAGNVGGTLGTCWARKGHQVTFGVRNPSDTKIQKLLSETQGRANAATIAQAVSQSPIIVLATPWEAAQSSIQSAGNLSGKILIDVINPLSGSPDALKKGLVLGHTTSAAEQIAQWAKGAKVVKAFNTIGAKNMADPMFRGQNATMFICGDDVDAKAQVKKLSDDLGFETVDAGPLTVARLLEPTAMLWIHLAVIMGQGPDFCFQMLKR